VHKTLYILGLICFICCKLYGQQEKSIKQIKQEFNSLKDNNSRIELASRELKKFQIKTAEDLIDVTEISEECLDLMEEQKSMFMRSEDFDSEYSDLMNDCYASFEKIQENDKYLEPKLLELMKKGEDETRLYAIKALGTIKSKKAAPEFRKKIKRFSRTKFNALKLVSQVRAYKYLFEAAMSAESLGSVAEESDYQMLVDRFYDLEGATGTGLLKIGHKGFMAIVDMARNEKEKHEDGLAFYALQAIPADVQYHDFWIEIAKNKNENEPIRGIAISRLVKMHNKEIGNDLYIQQMKENYQSFEPFDRCGLAEGLKRKDDVSFIIWILENEKDNWVLSAGINNLAIIGRNIEDPSAVIAALERVIYNHGNKEVRSKARTALISIGEIKSLVKLEDYILKNIDKANSNKYDDEIDLREIRKMLGKIQGDK
jgi:hypothetical protein